MPCIYIYLCNGLKVLEISESEYPKYHSPGTLFMNPPKSLRSQA